MSLGLRAGGTSPAQARPFLKGMTYPATKSGLITFARQSDAPLAVTDVLGQLECDVFESEEEVLRAFADYEP